MEINDAKESLRGVLDNSELNLTKSEKEAIQVALVAMERQAYQESMRNAELHLIEEFVYDFSLNENGRIPCETTVGGVKCEFEITKRDAKDFMLIFEKLGKK